MSEIQTSITSPQRGPLNGTWAISDLLNWSGQYLREKSFEDPRLNVELLLSHVLGCSRLDLYTHHDKPLTSEELKIFKAYFKRRLEREPIQYILGEASFMGLKFFVDKRVLIPRPETEILVETALELCRDYKNNVNILDVGVGSGNIAVCIAKFVNDSCVIGVDVSEDALEVARINVERYALSGRVKLKHCNIFNVPMFDIKFDIIVSNPPYISTEEMGKVDKEVCEYEPAIATTDSADGLTYYRRLVEIGKLILSEGGSLIVEIAYNQKDDVSRLFSDYGYNDIQAIKDYSRNIRVIRGRLSK
jgi:release factor glutamine methyltransferase